MAPGDRIRVKDILLKSLKIVVTYPNERKSINCLAQNLCLATMAFAIPAHLFDHIYDYRSWQLDQCNWLLLNLGYLAMAKITFLVKPFFITLYSIIYFQVDQNL